MCPSLKAILIEIHEDGNATSYQDRTIFRRVLPREIKVLPLENRSLPGANPTYTYDLSVKYDVSKA